MCKMIREMLSPNPGADSQAGSPWRAAPEEIQPGDLAAWGVVWLFLKPVVPGNSDHIPFFSHSCCSLGTGLSHLFPDRDVLTRLVELN